MASPSTTNSGNALLTRDEVAREATRVLAHRLGFGNSVRIRYDDQFRNKGAKIGDKFTIRIPPRYLAYDQVAMPTNIQKSEEGARTMTVKYSHVPLLFDAPDLRLHVDDFADRFLKPAVTTLANRVDFRGTGLYTGVSNFLHEQPVGTGIPTGLDKYLDAGAILTEEGVPEDDMRVVCYNAAFNAKIIDDLKGLYHDGKELRRQYLRATMREAAGLMWLSDQNMRRHKCGTRTNGAVNGAGDAALVTGSGGSQIKLDGLGNAGTVKAGDVFTIANVYAVNPQSRESTGRLRTFAVTEDKTATSGGAIADLPIFPPLVGPVSSTVQDKDQTVDSFPADNATVTWLGAASAEGTQAMIYHTDAFALAMVDDVEPSGVDFASRTKADDALYWDVTVSIIRDYEIRGHTFPCRVGTFFGWLLQRPEMAIRMSS